MLALLMAVVGVIGPRQPAPPQGLHHRRRENPPLVPEPHRRVRRMRGRQEQHLLPEVRPLAHVAQLVDGVPGQGGHRRAVEPAVRRQPRRPRPGPRRPRPGPRGHAPAAAPWRPSDDTASSTARAADGRRTAAAGGIPGTAAPPADRSRRRAMPARPRRPPGAVPDPRGRRHRPGARGHRRQTEDTQLPPVAATLSQRLPAPAELLDGHHGQDHPLGVHQRHRARALVVHDPVTMVARAGVEPAWWRV